MNSERDENKFQRGKSINFSLNLNSYNNNEDVSVQ